MMPEARVAPPATTAQAERIARQVCGFRSCAPPPPGEYDDNFHLVADDSRQLVLKIMHPAREQSFVDMQCCALTHLARAVPALTLPRVIPTVSSTKCETVRLDGEASRLVWLLSYIPGQTLAATNPHSPGLLASLGTFLAQLDTALLDFTHPAASRELKWDISRSSWARDYLFIVKDSARRELASCFLDLFELEALPRFPEMRRSVIYGDANDYNVLVSPPWPQPQRVLSVIDFGDMHRSLLVGELP